MNPNNIRIRIRSRKHYSLTSGSSWTILYNYIAIAHCTAQGVKPGRVPSGRKITPLVWQQGPEPQVGSGNSSILMQQSRYWNALCLLHVTKKLCLDLGFLNPLAISRNRKEPPELRRPSVAKQPDFPGIFRFAKNLWFVKFLDWNCWIPSCFVWIPSWNVWKVRWTKSRSPKGPPVGSRGPKGSWTPSQVSRLHILPRPQDFPPTLSPGPASQTCTPTQSATRGVCMKTREDKSAELRPQGTGKIQLVNKKEVWEHVMKHYKWSHCPTQRRRKILKELLEIQWTWKSHHLDYFESENK